MQITPTPLPGVMLVRVEPAYDERGSFARLGCTATLAQHGINFVPRQTSLSRSRRRGTLRGMHFQIPPSAETKLVQCVAGVILDVALDLRPESSTYRRAFHAELSADNGLGLLIPPGCAHGMCHCPTMLRCSTTSIATMTPRAAAGSAGTIRLSPLSGRWHPL